MYQPQCEPGHVDILNRHALMFRRQSGVDLNAGWLASQHPEKLRG